MSPSAEWHLQFGPVDFRIGIRTIGLSEALQELDPAPQVAAATPLPSGRALTDGRIRAVEDTIGAEHRSPE